MQVMQQSILALKCGSTEKIFCKSTDLSRSERQSAQTCECEVALEDLDRTPCSLSADTIEICKHPRKAALLIFSSTNSFVFFANLLIKCAKSAPKNYE